LNPTNTVTSANPTNVISVTVERLIGLLNGTVSKSGQNRRRFELSCDEF